MARAGIAWTRERLLAEAGLILPDHLGLAVNATVEALAAERKGQPDHLVRLAAADRIFDLADVRKPRNDGADPTRPVNVNILIGDRSAQALPARSGYVLELRPQAVVAGELADHKGVEAASADQLSLPDLSQGCA